MTRSLDWILAIGIVVATFGVASQAKAQTFYSTYYAPAPVTSYYAAGTTTYYGPYTSYYAPYTTYYAPYASYYAPAPAYYAPGYYGYGHYSPYSYGWRWRRWGW